MTQASRSLRVLIQIREMAEAQQRRALDAALAKLAQLKNSMMVTRVRAQQGRQLVVASVRHREPSNRFVGLEESLSADRLYGVLAQRILVIGKSIEEIRSQLLKARIERKQAEILIENANDEAEVQAGRRSQSGLDDWYRGRVVKRDERGER